jgi:hypothetical protein
VRQRNLDLWLILTLALAGLAVQLTGAPAAAHAVLGLCVAVVCPGYALTAALLPAWRRGSAERAALILGLSLALAILGAVIFNALPGGLTTPVWAGLASGVTLVGSLVAAWRRRDTPPSQPRPGLHLRPLEWAQLGLAGLVTLAAVWLVRVPISTSGVTGYTLLTIAPDTAQNQPGVHISISSSEFSATTYRLTVTDDDVPVREWPVIYLAPGETWDQAVPIGPARQGGHILALLYRSDAPATVYRSVSMVLGP